MNDMMVGNADDCRLEVCELASPVSTVPLGRAFSTGLFHCHL